MVMQRTGPIRALKLWNGCISMWLHLGDIMFEDSTIIKVPQKKMLSNDNKKWCQIDFLCSGFQNHEIETKRARTQNVTVRTALNKCSAFENVITIEEDVDLLVLLNGLGLIVDNVYIQKSSTGNYRYFQFSSTSLNHWKLFISPRFELSLHAFTGCDTTSAVFRKGKTQLLSILKKSPPGGHGFSFSTAWYYSMTP